MLRCAALVAGVVLLGGLGAARAADVDSTRAAAPAAPAAPDSASTGAAPTPAVPDSASAGAAPAPAAGDWAKPFEPEPAHERLRFYEGDWRFTMTHMLSGPEPTVSEGTAHCEAILGGRYFRMESKSVMGGAPFEGLGIFGYDSATGEHFNVWFDNASTGVLVSRGHLDEDETLLLTGKFADPRRGEVPYRMRTTVTGPDSYTIETFMTFPPSDREQKVMEAKYTRVKP